MKKIVSFDLDGTLVKSKYSDIVWLEGLPKLYSEEKNVSLSKAKKIIFKKYNEIGNASENWYDIDYWFNLFNLESSWKDLLQNYSSAIEPFNESERVLKKLSNNFSIIISSNAKKEFIDIQINKLGFEKYFIKMFSSISDFNCVKKDSKYYLEIAKALNVEPSEIFHVGDSYYFDYVSPKKIGINAFFLDRPGNNNDDYVVGDLETFVGKII